MASISEVAISELSSNELSANILGTGTVTLAAFSFAIYAATQEFITEPTDTLNNVPFFGTLQKALRVERSLLNGPFIGGLSTNYGELELINADGQYDNVVDSYSIDGRSVIV